MSRTNERRIWVKACPRCRGDLFREAVVGREHGLETHEMTCLQCGHTLTEPELLHLHLEALSRAQPGRAA